MWCLVVGFTDGGLLVMAGHIVPLDSVSVEIVEDSQTSFLGRRVLSSSSVVRLGKASSEMRDLSFGDVSND